MNVTFIIRRRSPQYIFMGVRNRSVSMCSFGGIRFPSESTNHAIWLYINFCLSHREMEELLCVCGVIVSYEANCYRRLQFG